ncbi:MAG: SURF1 family protein [Burkholderiales bacterium]|nr:SURF1 family protein [Burkholderiales bacterium]
MYRKDLCPTNEAFLIVRLAFRPRLGLTLIALAGLGLTVSACLWQYGRGQEKDRIAARMASDDAGARIELGAQPVDEAAVQFRRVSARGEFLAEALVLLDNQVRGATPGYVVFMPLRIAGTPMHVLVKRGWLAAPQDRTLEPAVRTPSGEITVEGLALPPNSKFLELSSATHAGRVWQNVTLERIAAATRLDFQPLILEQASVLDDGLERAWPKPASGSAKHYGYAFQWGAMAILIVVFFVVLHVRAKPQTPPAA